MSLFFNMLSKLVISFLTRSKHLLLSRLQSPFAMIWSPPKIKYVTVSIVSPSVCDEMMCKREKKKCEKQELPEALVRASGQLRSQEILERVLQLAWCLGSPKVHFKIETPNSLITLKFVKLAWVR